MDRRRLIKCRAAFIRRMKLEDELGHTSQAKMPPAWISLYDVMEKIGKQKFLNLNKYETKKEQ